MLQLKDELMHERENTFNLPCKIKWPWEAFSPFPQWLDRPQFPRCLWRTLRALSLQSKFDPINYIPRVLLQGGLAGFDTEMQLILSRNQQDFRMDS